MSDFPAVLFFAAIFLLWMPRLGWSATMPVIVTVALFGAALYIIVSTGYTAEEAKWAYGTAGAMIGYWLNSRGQ